MPWGAIPWGWGLAVNHGTATAGGVGVILWLSLPCLFPVAGGLAVWLGSLPPCAVLPVWGCPVGGISGRAVSGIVTGAGS